MLKLEIVTPEKRVLDFEVDSVTVPTASGEAGFLPQHAPLISAVKPGVLSYTVKGNSERVAVSGGFVEVGADRVSVLVDTAESADDIDAGEASRERADAERAIVAAGAVTDNEAEIAREAAELAAARLSVASKKSA